MNFSTIIAMLEEVDKTKIYASNNWKKIESAQPKLAKDFKLYLDKDKFKDFIDLANQVIEANSKGKTNAMFPKLDKETWQDILKVIEYMRKEDPRLKSGAKLSNDVWWHEKVVRESICEELENIAQRITELCEGYRAYDSSHEGEYVMVLVMGDEAAEQAEKDGKEYYGVNVCFYPTGKVEAACADKYAEGEWKKDKQKIIAIARPKADKLLKEQTNAISEGKNHLGETTYSSWAAWRAACKKIAPNVWYDGDKDIANAMVGPKPYVRDKTKSIGEWDGETGTVYKDAAETVASIVSEAALPVHAKLLNGDEVEMHKVDVYMNKKDGAILYLINGKTMSQYKATGKNLHADDVEML